MNKRVPAPEIHERTYALIVTVAFHSKAGWTVGDAINTSRAVHAHTTIIPIGSKAQCEKAKKSYIDEFSGTEGQLGLVHRLIFVIVPYAGQKGA